MTYNLLFKVVVERYPVKKTGNFCPEKLTEMQI